MGSVTITDVAQKAGVSVATVSRVLNNPERVTSHTREKVLAVCKELGYSPNMQAKRLKLGKSNTIAAVMPFLTLPSIVERLRGVQAALAESGYDLLPYSAESPEERENYLASLSNRSRADGVLIISMPITETQVARFQQIQMPVVMIDSFHPDLKCVIVDDVAGGRMATNHLIELGHHRIASISDPFDLPMHFSSMKDRFKGYTQMLEENGIDINSLYHKQGLHGRKTAKAMALELLSLPERPTAIFASSDTQAIGVLDAAREMGLSVPEDLSVVGYDDIRDAGYVNLTTIKQPLYESGEVGGRALIDLIGEINNGSLKTVLPLSLVIRDTTAPPANSQN